MIRLTVKTSLDPTFAPRASETTPREPGRAARRRPPPPAIGRAAAIRIGGAAGRSSRTRETRRGRLVLTYARIVTGEQLAHAERIDAELYGPR